MGSVENTADLLKAEARLCELRFSYMASACLKCAVDIGIPDALNNHGKPMTLSQLISALPLINPSKASSIYRVIRVLVNTGILIEDQTEENSCYSLTLTGKLLVKDKPINSSALVQLNFDSSVLVACASLGDWFKNDDPSPSVTAHGKSMYDLCGEDERLRNVFQQAMASDSMLIAKVLIEDCKFVFEDVKVLVDAGGGSGLVARALVNAFPGLKCLVLDRPEVSADKQGTKNLEFVAGDMLKEIPQANAIMLKWILHNWSDENCVKILKNCKKAIPPKEEGGKVIIIDMVVENKEESSHKNGSAEAQMSMDLCMLIHLNGKERTEKEWAALFQTAGFSGYKVFPVLGMRSIIEVYP